MAKTLLLLLLLVSGWVQAGVPIEAWEYQKAMQKSAWEVFGPGAPVAVLAAQIHQESAWKIQAKSWAGAEGPAQFTPGTAADMAQRYPQFCAPADPYSPRWAFACRDRYLASLNKAVRTEGTTECSEWAFGLRAYNGGNGNLRKDRRLAAGNGANPDDWKAVEPFNAGRKLSAWKENTEYPIRIFKRTPEYASWGRVLMC